MTDTTKTLRKPKPLTIVATNAIAANEGQIAPATTMPTATPDPEPIKPISKQAQLAVLVTRDTGAWCCQSDANSSLVDALILKSAKA